MFCSSCGHRNEKNANYCSSCGNYIADSVEIKTASIPVVSVDTEIESEENDQQDLEENFAFLSINLGHDASDKYILDDMTLKVGRHPESDIFLDDVTVSRRHAEFFKKNETYWVKDVNSLNGTYLNRERVEEAELRNADTIQIGKFKFRFWEATR